LLQYIHKSTVLDSHIDSMTDMNY